MLTRKMLKAMGIEDEKIEQIVDAHTEVTEGLKSERDQYKADAEKLAAVQQQLDELRANSGDDWKEKYNTLKRTFDDFKTESANHAKAEKIKAAYAQLLKDANVDSKRIDAILKITDMSGMTLDESGKLVDADKLSASIKSEWSAFIQTTGVKGSSVETPPENHSGTTMTRADVYAKDEKGHYKLSTAERQKMLTEHPEILKG